MVLALCCIMLVVVGEKSVIVRSSAGGGGGGYDLIIQNRFGSKFLEMITHWDRGRHIWLLDMINLSLLFSQFRYIMSP